MNRIYSSGKQTLYRLLRWSERFTKTDMVYLARGGFWLNFGSLFISLFSFVLYVAFAHFLSKEVYGTYQYLLSLAALVSTFTLAGMNTAVAQAVARGYDGVYRRSIRLQLVWSLIPASGAMLGAAYYAFQGNYTLAIGLLLIACATPFVTTFNTYSAYLLGKKDFRRVFIYNLSLNVLYYGGLIGAAFYFKSALVLLAVNLGVNAVALFVLYRLSLRSHPPSHADDPAALSFGKHLSLMGVFNAVVGQLDNILVFHYLGVVELAIYTFATAIPERGANFFKFISLAAMPKFAEKTNEEIRTSLGPKLLKLTGAALICAIIYMLLAPLFFRIFFPQYMEAVPFSMLYALSMLGVAGTVSLSALSAQRHTKDLYLFNAVTPVLQLILQLAGVLLYGLWGIVAGKVLSMLLTSGFSALLVLRKRREDSTPQTRSAMDAKKSSKNLS